MQGLRDINRKFQFLPLTAFNITHPLDHLFEIIVLLNLLILNTKFLENPVTFLLA